MMDTMHGSFDSEQEREGLGSIKWGYAVVGDQILRQEELTVAGGKPLLPMWVADMDFMGPPPVIEALTRRAARGLFGYTMPGDRYFEALLGWFERRHGWAVEREWIVPTQGVVPSLNLLVRTFVSADEKILIQPPVYAPFFGLAENNGVGLVQNPLRLESGRYEMDFDDLEAKCRDPQVTMAVLCHPHNPIGRVWSAEELRRFGEICLANGVLVVSDEIHGDLILPGHDFAPFASLDERFAAASVTCTAPSKSFNLAGLKTSNLIIPDAERRAAFAMAMMRAGLFGVNSFGLVAVESAYGEGGPWLDAALDYIAGNVRALKSFLAERLPQLRLIEPEGTYLVWLDCRALELDDEALRRLFFEEAGVYLDDGPHFGAGGSGFQRVNLACPRARLDEALERIASAIAALPSGPQT